MPTEPTTAAKDPHDMTDEELTDAVPITESLKPLLFGSLMDKYTKEQLFSLCCFYASAYNAGVKSAQQQGFEIYQHVPTIQGFANRGLCRDFAEVFDNGSVSAILSTVEP